MKLFFKPSQCNSGIALLMTLFVLIFLSVIAMNFSFSTRWGSASTRNFKDETKAYYAALSAYQETLGYLLSDKDNSVDFIDEDGILHLDREATKSFESRILTEEAEIERKITDEGAKTNINTADITRLKRLLDYIGVPEDRQQELIDSILDWKDPDKDHHLSGAEDEYYETLDPPYKAKNRNFDTVEELLLVKGFSEYLSDPDPTARLYNLVTTFGDGIININTVSKEEMEMLGATQEDIESVFKQRTKEIGGVTMMPMSLAFMGGLLRTTSSTFRIEIKAFMKGSNQTVKITSVVKKVPAANGFDFQTVYWKENIESRRS
ncbi:MAG: general secretion pathway protein GspK [Nitrospirae bacterium]|nr:general secretion pathway protein GspK [Nitrospirota bacterium]